MINEEKQTGYKFGLVGSGLGDSGSNDLQLSEPTESHSGEAAPSDSEATPDAVSNQCEKDRCNSDEVKDTPGPAPSIAEEYNPSLPISESDRVTRKQHSIDPALLKPAPRTVRHRKGKFGECKTLFFFLIPHVWIGIAMIVGCLFIFLTPIVGARVPATIEKVEAPSGEDLSGRYSIRYKYTMGGTVLQSYATISKAQYDSLREHASGRLTVREIPFIVPLPSDPAVLLDGKQLEPNTFLVLALPFAIFWNSIMFCMLWFGIGLEEQLRSRKITMNGKPVFGSIIEKQLKRSSRSVIHQIKYQYEPRATVGDDAIQTGVMRVTQKEWDLARPGDTVTILFMPEAKKQSLIYDFSQYRAIRTM